MVWGNLVALNNPSALPNNANVIGDNPSAWRHIGIVSGHNPFVMPDNAIALPDNAIAIGHNPFAMPDIASALSDMGLVSPDRAFPTAALT